MYQLTASNESLIRLADGASIPRDPRNVDYQAFLEWQAGGGVPAPAFTRAELESQAWERIKAERDRRTQQGGYQVAGKWFHSDLFSRTQQLGLVLLGAGVPAGLQWKTMDGSFVEMTQQLAGEIFAAAASSDIAIFQAALQHQAAMEASGDPAAYDFSGGWPPAFGE